MAEKNNSAQNEEILKTYFELNPEIKKQFDAMSPGEKSAFREKFFKDLKTERVKELHRGRNSDEWQQAIDELNVRVLQAMNKAPANLAKMPPKKRRETIEQTLNSFTPEENAKFIAVSNQAKKELLENFPPEKFAFENFPPEKFPPEKFASSFQEPPWNISPNKSPKISPISPPSKWNS